MLLSTFKLPTTKDLAERARAAYRANLKGSDAWVWPNNVYVSAKVIAGMVFEAFGYIGYIHKQMFAFSAPDIESLTNHGTEFGIAQRPAAPATGSVIFTDTGALTINTGAVLQRADGVQYIVTAGNSRLSAGTLTVPVIASTDGQITNAAAGTQLAIVSGVTGTAPTAEVDADGIVLGADLEDIESYRARILFRKRNPPHGGAPADYVMWAMQVSGVTRVFVERRWNGVGTIRVFPLMDDLYDDGIPSTADIARIQLHIDALAPAGALVTVAKATPRPINIQISGLTPDTTDTREAVLAELRDTFLRLSRVAGVDTVNNPAMPYLAYPTSFLRAWIWQAVGNADGVIGDAVVTPASDIALNAGELPTLGTVTFV